MVMRLKDKVIIITASTRGIGYSCVEKCAEEKAIVYMAARNLEVANEKAKALCDRGMIVKTVYFNALEKSSYQSMIEEVYENEGRIDVLVNNFGTSNPQVDLDIEHTTYEDFINTIDQNLASVYQLTKEVTKIMKRQMFGSIINISSIGGEIPDVARIGYAVSKNAIIYFSKNIALQLAKYNIRVNVVCPGLIATDAVINNITPMYQDLFLKHTPIQRMGKPEEIAGAVMYFCDDVSAYTTGQVVSVSGGFGLGTPVYAELSNIHAKDRH